MRGTNCLPSRGRGLFIYTLVKGSRHKYTMTEVNRDRGKQERKHKVELGHQQKEIHLIPLIPSYSLLKPLILGVRKE